MSAVTDSAHLVDIRTFKLLAVTSQLSRLVPKQPIPITFRKYFSKDHIIKHNHIGLSLSNMSEQSPESSEGNNTCKKHVQYKRLRLVKLLTTQCPSSLVKSQHFLSQDLHVV